MNLDQYVINTSFRLWFIGNVTTLSILLKQIKNTPFVYSNEGVSFNNSYTSNTKYITLS